MRSFVNFRKKVYIFFPMIDQAINSVGSFALSILLIKLIGLEAFAVYSSVLIVSWLGVQFSNDSVFAYLAMNRQGSHRGEEVSLALVGSSLIIAIFAACVCVVMVPEMGFDETALACFLLSLFTVLYEQLRRYLILLERFAPLLFLTSMRYSLALFGLIFGEIFSLAELSIVIFYVSGCIFVSLLFGGSTVAWAKTNLSEAIVLLNKMFYEVRYILGAGVFKYLNNQGFMLLMMIISTRSEFGLINFVLTLLKPLNFLLLPYENYLHRLGLSSARGRVIRVFVLLSSFYVVLLAFCVLISANGDNIIKSYVTDEYRFDFWLVVGFSTLYLFHFTSLLLRVFLRLHNRSAVIWRATMIAAFVPLGFWVYYELFGLSIYGALFGMVFCATVNCLMLLLPLLKHWSDIRVR